MSQDNEDKRQSIAYMLDKLSIYDSGLSRDPDILRIKADAKAIAAYGFKAGLISVDENKKECIDKPDRKTKS
jgi:hypothetical protein